METEKLHEGLRSIIKLFRESEILRKAIRKIHKLAPLALKKVEGEKIKIMHVCGTHEHTITYYGLRSLMPENIELIAGPGCPVCVAPTKVIDESIELALNYDVTLLTYGDMYKVPGTKFSLATARSMGHKVKVVYGFIDAVEIAQKKPGENFVFLGVGFETTAPTVASYISNGLVPKNLSILSSYRITVPIMQYILRTQKHRLSGIIAPGHVSTIIGASAWRFVAEDYGLPIVVSGFEPLDVMMSIMIILKQLAEGKPRLVNQYTRVVTNEGNLVAKKYLSDAFKIVDGDWRGIGIVSKSAWEIAEKYSFLDAKNKYNVEIGESIDIKPGCKCAEIVLGLAKPTDCPYYKKACTPDHPIGPCMVFERGNMLDLV